MATSHVVPWNNPLPNKSHQGQPELTRTRSTWVTLTQANVMQFSMHHYFSELPHGAGRIAWRGQGKTEGVVVEHVSKLPACMDPFHQPLVLASSTVARVIKLSHCLVTWSSALNRAVNRVVFAQNYKNNCIFNTPNCNGSCAGRLCY